MTSASYGSVPFKEQIEFFRKKINIPTSTYLDVHGEQHNAGFMVAGARGQVLEDFRSVLDKVIADGMGLEEFRTNFDDIVKRTGWAYNGGRNWRTRVIYETNLRQSYNAGREAQMADPELRKLRPYGLYRHGGSEEPREEHLSWDGLVLPLDDSWWETHTPQNGWGCKCKKFTVSAKDVERLGLKITAKGPEIEWEEVTIGARSGNPKTVRVPKGIDPGFEYRPGIQGRLESLTPRELPDSIVPLSESGAAGAVRPPLPPARPVAQRQISLDDSASEADYAQAFLDMLGADSKPAIPWKDVTGEVLPLSQELFKSDRGQWKIKKNNRHLYLHILAATLIDPDEIWLAWQPVKGSKEVLRRRYVRMLPEVLGGLAVFELGKDGWREITMFHITEDIVPPPYKSVREYVEAQRQGKRVYVREEKDQ